MSRSSSHASHNRLSDEMLRIWLTVVSLFKNKSVCSATTPSAGSTKSVLQIGHGILLDCDLDVDDVVSRQLMQNMSKQGNRFGSSDVSLHREQRVMSTKQSSSFAI